MQSFLDMMGTYNDAYFLYIMSLSLQFVKAIELYIVKHQVYCELNYTNSLRLCNKGILPRKNNCVFVQLMDIHIHFQDSLMRHLLNFQTFS